MQIVCSTVSHYVSKCLLFYRKDLKDCKESYCVWPEKYKWSWARSAKQYIHCVFFFFSREVQGEPCVLLELCVWDPKVDCLHPTMTLWWNVQACISTGELWELDTQATALQKLLQYGTLKRKDKPSEKNSLHKKSSRVFTPPSRLPWSP